MEITVTCERCEKDLFPRDNKIILPCEYCEGREADVKDRKVRIGKISCSEGDTVKMAPEQFKSNSHKRKTHE